VVVVVVVAVVIVILTVDPQASLELVDGHGLKQDEAWTLETSVEQAHSTTAARHQARHLLNRISDLLFSCFTRVV